MRVHHRQRLRHRSAARGTRFRWLPRQDADFICLQETKSQEHQLVGHKVTLSGYHSFFCDAGAQGLRREVALYTRHNPDRVVRGFGVTEFDREGRNLKSAARGAVWSYRSTCPRAPQAPQRQPRNSAFSMPSRGTSARLHRRRRHYIPERD